MSLKALKDARQFLVYFAEPSAKLAFELPIPRRLEAHFGNEKGSTDKSSPDSYTSLKFKQANETTED